VDEELWFDEPEIFGAASTQYNKWVGTVAFDDRDPTKGVPDLYDMAGLKRGEWSIVGIRFTGSREFGCASVLAASCDLITKFDDWRAIANLAGGRVPVTEFPVMHDDAALQLLTWFKRWNIRVVAGSVCQQGVDLEITHHHQPEDPDDTEAA
jgi:hypothetical protein